MHGSSKTDRRGGLSTHRPTVRLPACLAVRGWRCSKFGCKNAGFVEAVVLRGAELHRDTFHLEEDRVVFSDGSSFECDAIVACTGKWLQ